MTGQQAPGWSAEDSDLIARPALLSWRSGLSLSHFIGGVAGTGLVLLFTLGYMLFGTRDILGGMRPFMAVFFGTGCGLLLALSLKVPVLWPGAWRAEYRAESQMIVDRQLLWSLRQRIFALSDLRLLPVYPSVCAIQSTARSPDGKRRAGEVMSLPDDEGLSRLRSLLPEGAFA